MAWGNRVNLGSDFASLCEKIETNQTASNSLTILRSRFGTIWESHGCALKLASALEKNTTLEEFICSGFDFGVEGCSALASALKNNTTLKRLMIGHENFGDEQLQALLQFGSLGKVEVLDLERRNLTSKSATAIGRCMGGENSTLISVNLAFNNLGDEGIELLAKEISKITKVTTLDLKYNDIGESGVKALADALIKSECKLHRLDLSGNEKMGAMGGTCLSEVEANELLLDGCNIGDEGCITLLSSTVQRSLLSLCDNNISAKAATRLGELAFLKENDAHHILNLRLAKNTDIGDDGVTALGHVLERRRQQFPESNSIKFLDLSIVGATRISSHLVSGAAAALMYVGNGPLNHMELIEALAIESTIESLSLSGTGITDIAAVFRALHTHTSLRTIEFGGIPLDEAARAELDILRETNTKLDVAVDKGVNDENQ